MLRTSRPLAGYKLISILLLTIACYPACLPAATWAQPATGPKATSNTPANSGPTGPAGVDQPDETVTGLHAALLQAMKEASELGYRGRYRLLKPVIDSHFDTGMIAEVILDRHWDALDEQQRTTFTELFDELTAATYASRFNDYNGETFIQKDIRQLRQGRMLVRTELRVQDGESVTLDYVLHDAGDGWRIISVIANGVNDLALKRSEYSGVIEQSGFDGLITAIRNQTERLRIGS